MADPFLAEIIIFAGTFAPRGWTYCAGQLLAISSYTAVFSLVGTTYGGDGRTTFAIPDLRGRSPRGSEGNSAGPGLAPVALGARGGNVTHQLTVQQIPAHQHTLANNASEETQNATNPQGNGFATGANFRTDEINARTLPNATNMTGGSQAFDILNPYLGLNYIFALVGTFPSRN